MTDAMYISFNAALQIWWGIFWRFAVCLFGLLTILFLIAYAIYGDKTINFEAHGFWAVLSVIFSFFAFIMAPGTVAVQWFTRRNAKAYRIVETRTQ